VEDGTGRGETDDGTPRRAVRRTTTRTCT
jgi:hypothetical protein